MNLNLNLRQNYRLSKVQKGQKMTKIYSNPRKEYTGKIEDYPLENYPDYEPGKPPRVEKLWDIDFLDEVERITGSKWGGNQGIGKLREVVLMKPTEHEVNPLWSKDPPFFWFRRIEAVDLEKLQRGIEELGKIFEENGVKVHWAELTETMGAYGPMRKLFMMAQACTWKGGAFIGREGFCSYSWGRGANVNVLKFLAKINCPILHTINGKGFYTPGACVAVAEDAVMLYRSVSTNEDGLEQMMSVLKRCGVKEMPIANLTTIYDSFESGGEFHLDMVLATLDKRVVLLYPGYFDFHAWAWLKRRKFKIIEIPKDEHHRYWPANLVTLEPGKVIMTSEAKETIKRVEEAGIEVIPFDTSGLRLGSNGIACMVGRLVRDPGPGLED